MQRIFLFLACFFIFSADLIAQQYPFVFYTPKNGLVNSRVRKMYQDSRGRLYFITYGGLSVYDGVRYRNYTTMNGLGSDMLNDVLEVGEDSLLIAPNTSKLNVLVKGQLKSFQTDNNFCPTINFFLKSADGNIYITADEGLFILKGRRFEELKFPMPGMPAVLPFLGAIVESGDMLIMGANDLRAHKGLYLYDKKKRKLADAVPDMRLDGLNKDKKGDIWIGINNKIYMLDSIALPKGKIHIAPLPARYQKLSDLHASSFAFDGHNTWILPNPKEIYRAGNDGTLSRIKLPLEGGNEFFIDKENILWICSMGGGAFKLANPNLQIDGTLSGPEREKAINDASFTNDTVWYVINTREIARQTFSGTQVFKLNNLDYVTTCQQVNGRLFICNIQDLYTAAIPTPTDKAITVKKLFPFPDGSYGGVFKRDPYGNIIVSESGHVTIIRNDSIIFRYPLMINDLVQSIQFDKQNRLWMASRRSLKVFSLHPENPSLYMKEINDFEKKIFPLSARSMVLDKDDNIWLGTRYDGVMKYAYENNELKKILNIQTKDGLTDNFVTSLACDSSNMIIAGTQTGLDRLVHSADNKYRIENITKSNSVFGYVNTTWVDTRNHSHALINNNTILNVSPLPDAKGIYEPRLFIEGIQVNGIAIDPAAEKVQLSYTQRNINFNVAAPAFLDEQQVKYSYLLEGSGNQEWSEPSSSADINFLNLQPGAYTLHVKADFPSTNYSSRQLSYSFEIIPPWWERAWFRILVGILTVAILMLVLRYYYARKLEKERTILEKQQAVEKERTRIATDMHDDLGAGLSRIKFLSETIGIKKQQQIPIEEDITKIREYSHDMIDKMGEIVWALNKDNDTLSDLLSYTRAYAVEYLSQNGIQCVVEAPEQFPSKNVAGDFRRNIYLTVKEALHNIVKHSQATRVNIYMVTGSNLMITIEDNGTGFDEKKIRPFSNGLNNMKKRMESIGGKLTIKNETGTSVVLTVPLN